MRPARLLRSAIVIKPATILSFHRALVKRKYSLLFTPKRRGRPGPKGPSPELIAAIIEMKERNPRFGCRRIAEQLSFIFDVDIMDQMTRRIIDFSVHAGVLDGPAICRLFNQIIVATESLPGSLSSDNDPLFRFHRWKANPRN
jgi:hypothetical protein